ncbi:hypothetical protein ABV409_08785 [Flagellimonas sp. DF-77]|uniref:hypothetical protein n=1 Tax=Flagellimonas algarum TaxID=3230298 RepID=UPI0033954A1A
MAVHKEHGLLVFVDVSPSEQIVVKGEVNFSFENDHKWSMVGVVVDEDEGVKGLKQYKSGTWKKKLEHAENLVKAIDKKEINIYASGFISTQLTLMHLVRDVFNQANKSLGGKWLDNFTKYNWSDFDYPRSLMFGICGYTSMLSFIGLRVAIWLNRMGVKKATFLLDRLPTNSAKALEFSEALTKNSGTNTNWKENSKIANGGSFTFANLKSYKDSKGKKRSGEDHPNFIIADWLAVSMRANCMPKSFIDGQGNPRPTEEINKIAIIWQKLKKLGRAVERNLDDPKLKDYIEKRKKIGQIVQALKKHVE